MSPSIIILIVVVLVIVAVAAAIVSMRARGRTTERLRYGPEYDRLADKVGPARANEEFAHRRQRVDGLGIKSLSAERRTAYVSQWETLQEQFIDNPAQAVRAADELVTSVAGNRGYDVTDHDQLLTDLSVYHGRHLDGYRHSRQITAMADGATTEDLRKALVDDRSIFFDLIEYDSQETSDDARPVDSQVSSQEPAPRPWKQVTQGLHWKTRPQDETRAPAARR